MTTTIQTATPSKPRLYTGYALTTLVILFLVMDACFKFTTSPQVVETQKQLGFPMSLTPGIGVLALICTVLYAVPRLPSSVLCSSPDIWAELSPFISAWIIHSSRTYFFLSTSHSLSGAASGFAIVLFARSSPVSVQLSPLHPKNFSGPAT